MKLVPKYDVKLIDQKGAHFYTVSGTNLYLPGSTTVLGRVYQKIILIPWAAKITGLYIENYLNKVWQATDPFELDKLYHRTLSEKQIARLIRRAKRQYKYEKEKAAALGTQAHAFIDGVYSDPVRRDPIDPCIQVPVNNFYEWREESGIRIVQGDTKIASLKHGFGGSLDGLAENRDGRLDVIDYKTSNYTGQDYAYQVASYAVAAQETFGLDYLPDTRIIRFDKAKPHWEERKVINTEKAFEGFRLCLQLYNQMKIGHFELIRSNHDAVANEKIKKIRRRK